MAMIPRASFIKTELPDSFLFTYQTLKEKKNFCASEKFSKEATSAVCSGVLVANNIILTSAHCLGEDREQACRDFYWVKDYNSDFVQSGGRLPAKKELHYGKNLFKKNQQLFSCKKVLYTNYISSQVDIAFIQLNQSAGENYINLNKLSLKENSNKHISLGFPRGLPIKLNQSNKRSPSSSKPMDFNNMYAPQGSSGSPVYDFESKEFLGLISSSTYSTTNSIEGCKKESLPLGLKKAVTFFQKASFIKNIFNKIILNRD